MKSNEFLTEGYNKKQLDAFIAYVSDKLHMGDNMPTIKYSEEKEGPDQHRTGYYDANTDTMWIYTGNRNTVDIMRTVAHELTHHKQRLDGRTSANSPIVDLETQADVAAGMIMKLYVRQHPEIIE